MLNAHFPSCPSKQYRSCNVDDTVNQQSCKTFKKITTKHKLVLLLEWIIFGVVVSLKQWCRGSFWVINFHIRIWCSRIRFVFFTAVIPFDRGCRKGLGWGWAGPGTRAGRRWGRMSLASPWSYAAACTSAAAMATTSTFTTCASAAAAPGNLS